MEVLMIPIEFQNNRVAFLCFNADVLFEKHIQKALFIFYLDEFELCYTRGFLCWIMHNTIRTCPQKAMSLTYKKKPQFAKEKS